MVRDRDCGDFKDIPWEAWEILQGFNLFSEKQITPKPHAEKIICSPDISLTKNELAFLKRGPRFMMRQEVNEKDFRAELEKMTVKEKLNELNSTPNCDESVLTTDSSSSLTEEAESEESKAVMVYLKSERVLDLGKLKATDYKFNKHVYLPKSESTEREAVHEARRRLAMLDIFRQVTSKKDAYGMKDNKVRSNEDNNNDILSNLTRSEYAGMKSLQKRVLNGEIILTETDKSKKFCVIKSEQYLASGQKHTKKDLKISYDQVKTIQKIVNDHSSCLQKIFGIGASWGHEDRLSNSMTDRGEVVAPLYLLVKDHKGWSPEDGTPPPPHDQSAVATEDLVAISVSCCH